MCGMSRTRAGGAGRGGGSERDGKFVLKSPAGGGGCGRGRGAGAGRGAGPAGGAGPPAPGLPPSVHPGFAAATPASRLRPGRGVRAPPLPKPGLSPLHRRGGVGLGGTEGGAPAGERTPVGVGVRVPRHKAPRGARRPASGIPTPHPARAEAGLPSRRRARPPLPAGPAPPWRLRPPCPDPVCLVLPERLVSRISPFPPLPGPPRPPSRPAPGARGGRLATAGSPSFGRTGAGPGRDTGAPGAWAEWSGEGGLPPPRTLPPPVLCAAAPLPRRPRRSFIGDVRTRPRPFTRRPRARSQRG